MTFAAKIVVRKHPATGKHEAGFASQVKGETVEEFGKWYGIQMSYRPFRAAWAAAKAYADKLNSTTPAG